MIRVGDEPFGVLEVDSPVEGRFTQADLTFRDLQTCWALH